jgi:hypothetical protein
MRLASIFITLILLQFCSTALAQEITLNKKNITLGRLFEEIKKQTGYDFLYNPHTLEKAKPVDIEAVKTPLRTVLDNCFAGQPLTYTIDQQTIIVKEKQANHLGFTAIWGKVADKNSKPVANASVFLSNGTIGCQTDTAGRFRLENVKPGKYDLVVSMVGYETYHLRINAAGEDISLPGITLESKTINLNEVVIKLHNDRFHQNNLYSFTRDFLGTTYLAEHCKIVNPEVIDFDYDNASSALYASTNGNFLIIDNNALGYRILYLLDDFVSNSSGVKYSGSVLFEPMHGSPSQERRWAKRREQVYASSEMHFMRALLERKVENDGFRVLAYLQPADTVSRQKILSHIPMPCTALLHATDQDGLYAFGTKYKALYVEYNPNHRFHENDRFSKLKEPANFEASVISFTSPYLYFDQNGWVSNPNDVSLLGAWENYRVAGMLPADYEPEPSVTTHANIAAADTTSLGRQLRGLKNASDTLNNKYAAEKVYIQYDKPYYAVNDTIWFKAYLLNEPTYGLSARSGLLHVDIANDSNKVIKQYLFPVQEGLAWGKISLDNKAFQPGNYVLRAYTQWMRNFGNDALYYKNITITGAGEGGWLVNENIAKPAGKERITAQLQFTGMDKAALANKPLQIQVKADRKTLYKQNVTTDANGLLNTSFSLPGKASALTLIAEERSGGRKAVIPVAADREKNIDLQFMPEGGSLIAGFHTRVGFKAIGSDGRSIDVTGIVIDQNQREIAVFTSFHNGMGSLDLLPEKGAQYTAKITLAHGSAQSYRLPVVKTSGTILQVKDLSADSLLVSMMATDSAIKTGNGFFFIAKARGVICYAAVADLRNGRMLHLKLSKSLFPSGIAHLVLATVQGRPLNERLVYIDHEDKLHLAIKPDRQEYNPKDSVALHIKVTDDNGRPVIGNFSLAVTDNAQVRTDSLGNDNIFSRMLLTSDLEGYVEEPGYYFRDNDSSRLALDNLLLTQGGVNYDPPTGKMPYEAETEFKVRGRVNNVFNKGLKKTEIVLLSTHPQVVMDTVSDQDGRFVFDHFPRIDTPVFVLKSNKRNFNVNIGIEETPPPAFIPAVTPSILPWYVNPDTTLIRFVKSNTQMQQLQYYPGGGRVLKEVKITAKKIVKDSYNPNGPGEADIVIDEKDAEAAGKKTWWQLCQEKIPGFNEILELDEKNNLIHRLRISKKHFILIVNGEMMSRVLPPDYTIKEFLQMHNAEDIKGLEVAKTSKYVYRYMRMYFASEMIDPDTLAFVEITTRSGDFKMPFTPGTYLYKPLAITWPKKFYKPKYTMKDTANLTDLRSTVDWEPNISTDKNGEATVWFYAAGMPSAYSIIMEGVDGNGLLGYKRQKLLIAKPKPGIGK